MKVCVVVRRLESFNAPPIAMSVIGEPQSRNCDADELEHYFLSTADEIIAEFKRKFVEFSDAKFYTYILETQ